MKPVWLSVLLLTGCSTYDANKQYEVVRVVSKDMATILVEIPKEEATFILKKSFAKECSTKLADECRYYVEYAGYVTYLN